MATIREYVRTKLTKLVLDIEDIELDAFFAKQKVDDSADCDADGITIANRVLVDAIPELLLLPDVQEGNMSIKRDRKAIITFYGYLCSELGIVNRFESKAPSVKDRSFLW